MGTEGDFGASPPQVFGRGGDRPHHPHGVVGAYVAILFLLDAGVQDHGSDVCLYESYGATGGAGTLARISAGESSTETSTDHNGNQLVFPTGKSVCRIHCISGMNKNIVVINVRKKNLKKKR